MNTLAHVRRVFSKDILAVVGGTHLVSANGEMLTRVTELLGAYCGGSIPWLYPNHCTGERAFHALLQGYGEKVQSCPAGTVLNIP